MSEVRKPERSAAAAAAPTAVGRGHPLRLLCFAFVPVLPLLVAMAMLAFAIEPTARPDLPLVTLILGSEIAFIAPPVRTLTHLGDLLGYLSITAVHGVVCLISVGWFLLAIHRLPDATIRRIHRYMLVSVGVLLGVSAALIALARDSTLTQIGYKTVCMLLGQADLQTAIVWPDPGAGGSSSGLACLAARPTRLVFLAYGPVAFGVAVIWTANSLNTVMAGEPMPADDAAWRAEFLRRADLLRKGLYLSSLVLVTSTVSIFQFTSLPLDLLADGARKAAYAKFAGGITAFWGGLFTATLAATLAPATWLLFRQARQHLDTSAPPAEFGRWLHESVFVSLRKQLVNVLAMIAPMLVGPLGSLLQGLAAT